MKTFVSALIIFLFCCGLAFAEGGKVHGDKGKGTVATGSDAQGQASQKRAGR
jgi:hypothetical protein